MAGQTEVQVMEVIVQVKQTREHLKSHLLATLIPDLQEAKGTLPHQELKNKADLQNTQDLRGVAVHLIPQVVLLQVALLQEVLVVAAPQADLQEEADNL